ncbi:hypothetical protein [Erythrobacter ani]|uniref:Uncharacterized protein n=1 Tax=Erythrobacter ani TaxID=2827235 RepID=A0ABS6SIJ3_9SPHN|nr:hypothetical protein [Erythrobacter ani]MBV7264830.1 hypothetical protein [Erythrobacter ani]
MRAHTIITRIPPRLRKALLIASAPGLILTPSAIAAQSSPGTFSLPEPTPTPTPAPQGPVDERDGVVLGPVTIPDPREQQAPANPQPSPEVRPAPPPAEARTTERPVVTPETVEQTSAVLPDARPAQPQTGTASPKAEVAASPQESEAGSPQTNAVPQVGSDILNDIAPDAATSGLPDLEVREAGSSGTGKDGFGASALAALIALLAGVIGLGWWIWRKKVNSAARTNPRETSAYNRTSIDRPIGTAPTRGVPSAAKPAAVPAAHGPLHIDLQLDIVRAQRSVMNFSVEYRIAICNRSDHAARDVSVGAVLTSAAKDSGLAAPAGVGRAQKIERIGPHQSRTITGEAQLPLGQVQGFRQGKTPLFIPLLHVTIAAPDLPERTRTFVVGVPSSASQSRLHPIQLDTPPGSLSGLRAQEIKQSAVPEPA